MNPEPNRELAVFSAALELPASERAAYLRQACAGDPTLRLHVEALLGVHEKAITFLEAPAHGLDASALEGEVAGATARLSGRKGRRPDWPLQIAPTNWRGRLRCGLYGRAGRASPSPGGP